MSNRIGPGRRPARDAVAAIYPLLPLQQGMLFHDLLTPGDQPYFRQVSFRIESEADGFDPALCREVWRDLIARHEALRSVFDFENTARLLQLVLKQGVTAFDTEDLSPLDADAQTARIDSFRAEDRGRGFDPRGGPLTRIRLFELGRGRFEMVWSHAHIILDGWSGSLLLAEFAELYAAKRAGRPPDLLPAPSLSPYLDHIAARDEAASRRYWAELLAGYEHLAGLPRLGLGRSGAPYHAAQHVVTLTPERHQGLERLAARAGVTLNTMLVALWGILLGRYADSDDVVFGSVVSGRTLDLDGIERMVGAFINTIPVRVTINEGDRIADLLGRVQAQAFDSLSHDHLPLAEIQARSDLSSGLLDHLLVFENYPDSTVATDPALGFRVVAAEADERANYDFGLVVQPGPPLRIVFNYNAEAHSEAQMHRLGEQIATLIDALAADPDRPLAQIDVLGAAERAKLAAFATGAKRTPPPEETIVALWRAQVARTPERIALVWDQTHLTYRELDRRSDRLAAALRRLPGFGAEQPVGVLANRGGRRIVALLGILKAGGAYLPLTPALPDERLGFILDDTDCRIVLADAPGRVRLDAMRPGIAREIDGLESEADGTTQVATVAPDDLAYILYTSGSTGQPKGVMVEHRGFVNMILGQIEGFDIGPDDKVLQVSSCSFDASLSEIFMALLAGGTLVLAGSDTILDRSRLLAVMADQAITVAGLSPSLLSALDFADFPGLRLLISAGEAVDPVSARHYAARLRFINAYGPTEASVCASYHEVGPERAYPAGIPIGRPIPNSAIRILDRLSRPVPIGAVGEICLSGPGLARGYRNSADLTRAKFIGEGAERFYRTGDLGLWLEEGEIVYRGRRDGQVKLNGRRVELGEIEAALRAVPGIAQAAVIVARAGEGRAGQLVAYVVAASPPDPEAVRRQLVAILPSYMIPSALVTLAALPLTLAGKLDRKALPPPVAESAALADPPANPAEQAVAAAFETVLGRGPVGRSERFQALGGDSLAAIRVVGRLSKLGFDLTLADLLERQSVADIAAVMVPRRPAVTVAPPESPDAPLTPIQAAFFADHHDDRAHYNHAVLLKAAEPIEDKALAQALAALWRQHDALRLRFHLDRDPVTQSAADPLTPPAPVWVDLRGQPDPWAAMRADVAIRHRGFDLATGPLLAAIAYRSDEGDFLVLLAHHLITDAVSWRFLLDDLATFDRQARQGAAIELPPGGASYLEWARALDAYRDSDQLADRKAFWDAIDAAPLRRLGSDGPVVPHRYDETGTFSVELPVAPNLPDNVVQARLLSALAQALATWDRPGPTRVLVSSHGRLPIPGAPLDIGRTVGWFTAEYPIVLSETDSQPDSAGGHALEYGVLRLGADKEAVPRADIAFNYLGRIDLDPDPDAPFVWVPGLDPASAGRLERVVPLEIGASRLADRVELSVRYCDRIHRPDTIRALVAALQSVWSYQS